MTKRLMALALGLCLMLSLGIGAAGAEADPYGPMAEKITIHVGRGEDVNNVYLEGQDSLNNYLVDHIRKSLNVEFVYDFSVPSDYAVRVEMAISSGEIPDVMIVTASQLRDLVEAGAVEDMTDVYAAYASPSLKAGYDTSDGVSFANATFNDRLMAMPNIRPGADGIPLLFVRGDWMEALGLEAPKTVEDIVAIVNAFKENYGASNSLVVSQNIASRTGNNTYGLDALFALYDAYPKHWIKDAEGKLVYGSVTEQSKTALAEIRKLVESGIIDASFTVRDSDQCAEIVTSGQAGVFFGAWWNMSWPLNNMVTDDPTVFWNAYAAPLSAEGKYNTPTTAPSDAYLVVKKGSSEAMKEAVVKVMNYQFDIDQDQGVSLKADPSDPYGWTGLPFSILLSTVTDKEAKAKGVLDAAAGLIDPATLTGEAAQWYASYTQATADIQAAIDAGNIDGWAYVRGCQPLVESEALLHKVYDATYAQTETMNTKWATLETLEDEYFLKCLNGDASVDDFESFVDQWNSLGGEEITQELAALLN